MTAPKDPTPEQISAMAKALGRLGGLKGGPIGGKIGGRRRAEKLSKKRRREIASAAARARWARVRKER
jgi:hypothetical protein